MSLSCSASLRHIDAVRAGHAHTPLRAHEECPAQCMCRTTDLGRRHFQDLQGSSPQPNSNHELTEFNPDLLHLHVSVPSPSFHVLSTRVTTTQPVNLAQQPASSTHERGVAM